MVLVCLYRRVCRRHLVKWEKWRGELTCKGGGSSEQPQSQVRPGCGREEASPALLCLAAGCVLARLSLGIRPDWATL